jgi:chemotaxis protein methyltransferase CheR
VAILLDELGALGPGGCELVGTDCRPDAIARAAAGTFDAAAVRAVPPDLLARHFTFDGTHYRVARRLRDAARWQVADVLDAAGGRGRPPGPADLVLCRNLAIYLQPDAAAALWASLAGALREGGVLVLGKAERPLGVAGLRPAGPCLYRKGAA